MKFIHTQVAGAYLIQPEPIEDERGFFANMFTREDFAGAGLSTDFVQSSVSYNRSKATLRGLHYQIPPHEEVKIVRCLRGRIFDVVVDLRVSSETYGAWTAAELSDENRHSLYVPALCAQGFVTLEDDCEVSYMISAGYAADFARGVRWNDPGIAIDWPVEPQVMSERDRTFPDFDW